MSKENVALFVRMIAEKKELNKRAAEALDTEHWIALARDAGLEFTANDLASFVGEIIGKPVTPNNAVIEFTRAMTDRELNPEQLDAVAGGTITFSPTLSATMVRSGYPSTGGLGTFVFFSEKN